MYIPVSYWQAGTGGNPHLRTKRFNTSFSGPPQTINYTYDNLPYTTNTVANWGIIPVCLDANYSTNLDFAATLPAGGAYFCTAAISGTIGINCYPQTGPEAWYIDVTYQGSGGDRGTFYYNYIDQNGVIINDTLSFGETKRIISQSNPLTQRSFSSAFQYYISWTTVSKFPGQVLVYPYKDIAGEYTMTLKRGDSAGTASIFPTFSYESMSVNYTTTNSGSFSLANPAPTGIGSQLVLGTINPPLEIPGNNGRIPPSCWMTVNPLPIKYNIINCETSQSYIATFTSNVSVGTTVKSGDCFSILSVASASVTASLNYNNLVVNSSYNNCTDCTTTLYNYVSGAAVIFDFGNGLSYPGTGSLVYDISGNGITGSLTNTPTYSTLNGGVITLARTLQQRLDWTGSISASFTTMAFVKNTDSNWNTYQGIPNIRGTNGVIVSGETTLGTRVNTSLWNINTTSNTNFLIPASITDWASYNMSSNGTNSHILFISSSATSSIDIDSASVSRGNSPALDCYINYDSPNGTYGNMQVMGYLQYNRVLTDSEINQNYNLFSSRF